MFIKSTIATILVIGFCNSGMAAYESAAFENLKAAWALKLMQDSYDRIVPSLLENGATDEEAAQVLIDFGTAATECIFDAAKSSAEKRSIDFDFDYVVAKLDTTDLRPLFRDEAEFQKLVSPCVDAALKKSGITLPK